MGLQTRRSLLAAIPALSVPLLAQEAAPEGHEILKSFDARDWAKNFAKCVRANPSIPFDEETMVTWFANALMRGYDEKDHNLDEQAKELAITRTELLTRQEICGAVARGWCGDINSSKVFDGDIAIAIVDELMKLRTA